MAHPAHAENDTEWAKDIRQWGYQLSDIVPATVAASPYDVSVDLRAARS